MGAQGQLRTSGHNFRHYYHHTVAFLYDQNVEKGNNGSGALSALRPCYPWVEPLGGRVVFFVAMATASTPDTMESLRGDLDRHQAFLEQRDKETAAFLGHIAYIRILCGALAGAPRLRPLAWWLQSFITRSH